MEENSKERIGSYELIDLIGDGAQGRVYRARCVAEGLGHTSHGEEVALKVVRMTGEDDTLRVKFQRQAEILRRLSHTSIVGYRECFTWHPGEWDEAQCLVMELLTGEPLSDRLKKAGSGLPWPQVEEIFEQCLSALIHARECGITHRDIKPSNIFLTVSGAAKLIDFDIARQDNSGQMSTAGWKGTFDYMAPDFITVEGFRGDEVSDIFSLGVCFYQALTGTLPFEKLGDTAHIGYLNRWRSALPPTPSFRPGVFRVLGHARNVVAKSIAFNRAERYQSFAEMLEEFRKIRYRRLRHKGKEEYELLAVLGRGGFGEVFKARRSSDGMLVAIKYLFSEKQSDRFIKEARMLQQNAHPHLVQYVDFMIIEGTGSDKQFFLVMEFLEGMPEWTLRYRIKHDGAMDPAELVPLFSGYLAALQALHSGARPIIHRDIKPGNLYAPVGQPEKGKIFDLGVARDVSGTVTVGGVPGTLDYMPPEFGQTGGDRGSPQSDLYAIGLCLYESLTGKPVFERLPHDLNSAWAAFQDRIKNPPAIDYSHEVFQRYPRLKRLVQRSLAANPAGRHASAQEMLEDLRKTILPETQTTADDELLDAGEVTMATFAGAGPDAAEAGVTLGTRPLEMLGDKVDLAAVGRQVTGRERRRRTLLYAGGAAALLLVAGGIAVIAGANAKRGAKTTPPETTRSTEDKGAQTRPAPPEARPDTTPATAPGATPTAPQPATVTPPPAPKAEPPVEPKPAPKVEPPAQKPAPQPVTITPPSPPKAEPPVEPKPAPKVEPPAQKPAPQPVTVTPPSPPKAEPPVEPKPAPKVEPPAQKPAPQPVTVTPPPAPKAEPPVEPKPAPKVEPPAQKPAPQPLQPQPAPGHTATPPKTAPATEPLVAPAPKTETRVTTPAPAHTAAPEPKPAAGDNEAAAFDISVVPKTALIKVDGRVVTAGKVEISADENHQVLVTCKGYKTVQQYYRAKPGETRRIDIMLEKEAKRSFLGL